MKILNQRLLKDDSTPYSFQLSPNIGPGKLDPKFLVIHYTEGASLAGSVLWLTNKESLVSSHLAIGRDGTIIQMVPFDRIAWHAGVSTWDGLTDLNRYSIGIELDNAGMLQNTPRGWMSSFNHVYPDDQVIQAVHQFGTKKYGWQTFTPAQLQACQDVAVELVKQYNLQAILGHDEIAPKRKWDPGPAFPMNDFRTEVMTLANGPLPPKEPGPVIVTTTPPVTTPPAGTTTPPVTTPPAGTTTPPVTTPPAGTTTPPVTTPPPATTPPAGTSTPPVTTPPAGMSIPPVTTPPASTTTPPVTTPPADTPTPPDTTPAAGTTTPTGTTPPAGTSTPPATIPPAIQNTVRLRDERGRFRRADPGSHGNKVIL